MGERVSLLFQPSLDGWPSCAADGLRGLPCKKSAFRCGGGRPADHRPVRQTALSAYISAFAGHSAGRQPPAVCRAGILSVPVHAVFPQLYPRRFWRQPYFQCNAGKGRISQISARRCPKLYSGFSCAAVCAVFLLLSSLPSAGCMAFRRAAVAGCGRLGSAGGFPHDERSLPSVCVRPHGACACPQHRVRLARHRRGAGGGIRAAAAGP